MEATIDQEELLMHKFAQIISSQEMHARWLNTLSYLENCGARKIAACEHPTKVPKQMLKHAAEEFRHAYYLKQQVQRLGMIPSKDYQMETLIGGYSTLHYLDKLETGVCRLLKKTYKLLPQTLKEAAYLLVTYAIEVRASQLYPAYQQALTLACSKISVRSIIVEEDHHLAEMTAELQQVPFGQEMARQACALEQMIFCQWMNKLA